VLKWAPEATGGVLVTRKYYSDIPLSEWVFKGVQEGDITEMSYAYEIHAYEIREQEDDPDKPKIRVLKDVELYDISDVNWGMNPATAGVKGLPVTGMTFAQHSGLVVATVEEFTTRVKERAAFRAQEGRNLAQKQRERLAKLAEEITAVLHETEPKADEQDVLNEIAKFERHKAQV